MISFRYHLVSIIAVFLALALGIVVGTTGLNGAILSDLRSNVKSQKAQISKLNDQNSALQKQANNADDFASSYSKQVLSGSLTGQTVLVLSAPGADSKIKSGVEKALTNGGATITGKIQFSADYVDPQRGADISNLAVGGARPAGLQLPVTSDSATLGAALLAYVLAGKGTTEDINKVLAAFSSLHMLQNEGTTDPKSAKIIVLVGSGTAAATDPKTKAMPVLVNGLNQAGLKVVVAGNSASDTAAGLIALVRADSILPRSVSTVDNADTGLGQVSTVLAAAGLVAGTTGQYGTGPGATALFPSAPK